jgi:hypothetical protein
MMLVLAIPSFHSNMLTRRDRTLAELLKAIQELRTQTAATANEGAHRSAQAETRKEIDDQRADTVQRIMHLWEQNAHVIKEMQRVSVYLLYACLQQ